MDNQPVPRNAKNWCYMIVTPQPKPRDLGIRCEVDSLGKKATVYQWLVKFGDGDPDITGRYTTHNPYYSVAVNKTGRKATDIERAVFRRRGFESAGESKEWYVVWDRSEPAGKMRSYFESLLKEWARYDLQKPAKLKKLINLLVTRIIPDECSKAV